MTLEPGITGEALVARMRWRYAVRKFDPRRKIDPATWHAVEEAMVLTPSSYGLQPWRFVVVTDPALREQLVPASFNQRQVADASHLVVLCTKKHLRAEDIDAHVKRTAEVRGVPVEALERFRGSMIRDLIDGARSRVVDQWAANQVFIALGNLLTCAALLGLDACPMEGFDPARYDQVRGLAQKGLASTVLCAVGYRAEDDRCAALAKVRFPLDVVVEHIGPPAT